MDSLTQLVLGAAVGEAALGRSVGRRALLAGAVLGTLPDLDVLVRYGDAVTDVIRHRSWSHSLIVLAAVSPLVAGLLRLWHDPGTRWGWTRLVFAVFATHVLLDACTVYGTQLWWPWTPTPTSWSTIFIIDPVYTAPLVLGSLAALIWQHRRPSRARTANTLGLVLSSIYLAWTGIAKVWVEHVVDDQLEPRAAHRVLTTPTPFNSLLWRIVAVDDTTYREGYWSVLTPDARIEWTVRPRRLDVLGALRNSEPVRRIDWFTNGLWAVERRGADVAVVDLRMGASPKHLYRFVVGTTHGPGDIRPALPTTRWRESLDYSYLPFVWRRLVDADARWTPH